MLEESEDRPVPIKSVPRLEGALRTLGGYGRTLLRSSCIGYVVGVIPGAGSSVASLVSYGMAKRSSRTPESFGKGNPEGVVASEAANNASVSGALAPLLALGIPGSASAAVLIGGLSIQGLEPGPLLFQNHPEIPYSIFVSLLLGLPIMLALGLMGVRVWVRVTLVPKGIVASVVAGICLLGAYASTNDVFTVAVTAFFGVAGYLLRKVGVHPAPVVLALVLGYLMESNFRRAMLMSGDDWSFFVSKPIAAGLLGCALLVLVAPLMHLLKRDQCDRQPS
ncbi:tripartite tricarboxylate transporter permease [Marinobacterium aestuariivivens]|uniref:Tripartite tricarboxylate transporter permease n=1 Tax=Marinobacterium aestuariivivens TaxID=1698799 RepID=A0ABW2A9K6_9GAMM